MDSFVEMGNNNGKAGQTHPSHQSKLVTNELRTALAPHILLPRFLSLSHVHTLQ